MYMGPQIPLEEGGGWAFPSGQVSKLMQETNEHGGRADKEKAAEVFRASGN